jgi:hypothetical protein
MFRGLLNMPKGITNALSRVWRVAHIACITLLVLLIGLFIYGQIALNTPESDFTAKPLSLHEFRSRSSHGADVPATATNFYYATAHRGFVGFVDMYRFDAPLADCIAHGKQLLQQNGGQKAPGLVALTEPPQPFGKGCLDAMGLSKVDWFDVETIRSGFSARREPASQPGMTFWIDADRGRFYFYSSD